MGQRLGLTDEQSELNPEIGKQVPHRGVETRHATMGTRQHHRTFQRADDKLGGINCSPSKVQAAASPLFRERPSSFTAMRNA